MNILAIDTAMGYLSLALMKEHTPPASHHERSGVDVSRSILAKLDDLLDSAGLAPAQLDLLAVTRGPGSFTGTRIGIAVAQTFAQVLDIPTIGIDTLHLIAAQTEPTEGLTFYAGLNCVRKEVYWAPFQWRKERPVALDAIKLTDYESFLEKVRGKQTILRRFEGKHTLTQSDVRGLTPMTLLYPQPDAILLARQAMELFRRNPEGPWDPVAPLYIKSEVLRKWKA
jgi:tRNA threonylcarbamoyl adenosine modification protein YeaZ